MALRLYSMIGVFLLVTVTSTVNCTCYEPVTQANNFGLREFTASLSDFIRNPKAPTQQVNLLDALIKGAKEYQRPLSGYPTRPIQWRYYDPAATNTLDTDKREAYRISIHDGKLYSQNGKLFDTSVSRAYNDEHLPYGIFIMTEDGKIFASGYYQRGSFQHPTLGLGNPVSAAGELWVEDGIVKGITNQSGHYMPSGQSLVYIINQLMMNDVPIKGLEIGVHDSMRTQYVIQQ